MLFLGLDAHRIIRLSQMMTIVSVCSSALPAWVGIRRWHLLNRTTRYIAGFAIVPGLLLGIAAEVGRWIFQNNVLALSATTLFEMLLLAGAYAQALHSRPLRRWLGVVTVVFVLLWLAENGLYLYSNVSNSSYTHMFQTIVIIGLALCYFEQLLRELPNIQLEHDAMFLVSVGACLYYAGSITVFMLEPYMQAHSYDLQIWMMFTIQSGLYILLNGLFALALYYAGRRPQPSLPRHK